MSETLTLKILSIVATIGTLGQIIYQFVTQKEFQLTGILILSISIAVVSIIIYSTKSYEIKKRMKYFLSKSKEYKIREMKSVYTIYADNEIGYKKTQTLQATSNNLSEFSGRFKSRAIDDLTAYEWTSVNAQHDLVLSKGIAFTNYTIKFDPLQKGEMIEVGIALRNDTDEVELENKISSYIMKKKIKKLLLKVEFKGEVPLPKSACLTIYDNQEDMPANKPILIKEIPIDTRFRIIEHIESYPIKGYKYQIKWKY